MKWSYSEDRMLSAYEINNQLPKKNRVFRNHYFRLRSFFRDVFSRYLCI
jgi:hypothetical protein